MIENGASSGLSNELEIFDIPDESIQFLRMTGNGNSVEGNNWNNITELQVWGELGPFLDANKNEITLAPSGKSVTFEVESNSSWSISNDADWLSITPSEGNGNTTVTISTTSANTSDQVRNATLSMTGGEDLSYQVEIVQSITVLSIDKETLLFESNASDKTINITSNSDWTISNDAEWLTIDNPKGSGNADISISASTNTNETSRQGSITVSDGRLSKTISITQAEQKILSTPVVKSRYVKVYPIPATNWLYVDGLEGSKNSYEIFDLRGGLISKGEILEEKIYVAKIARGLLLLKIITSDGKQSTRSILLK